MKKILLAAIIITVAHWSGTKATAQHGEATWSCWTVEPEFQVGVGNHPGVIMFLDTLQTPKGPDRQVCVLSTERFKDNGLNVDLK